MALWCGSETVLLSALTCKYSVLAHHLLGCRSVDILHLGQIWKCGTGSGWGLTLHLLRGFFFLPKVQASVSSPPLKNSPKTGGKTNRTHPHPDRDKAGRRTHSRMRAAEAHCLTKWHPTEASYRAWLNVKTSETYNSFCICITEDQSIIHMSRMEGLLCW